MAFRQSDQPEAPIRPYAGPAKRSVDHPPTDPHGPKSAAINRATATTGSDDFPPPGLNVAEIGGFTGGDCVRARHRSDLVPSQ